MAAQARVSLHFSKCHIVGNLMSRLICVLIIWQEHPKAHRKWFYGEAGNRTCEVLVSSQLCSKLKFNSIDYKSALRVYKVVN